MMQSASLHTQKLKSVGQNLFISSWGVGSKGYLLKIQSLKLSFGDLYAAMADRLGKGKKSRKKVQQQEGSTKMREMLRK
jgi:hypothetical protein